MFVHVEPDEHAAIARIPAPLRFPAPGRPRGHLVLPYDQDGRCPMLADATCTIYAERPRTCRAFDCRVLAATGIRAPQQPLVDERAQQWRFDEPTADDDRLQRAVQAAARFLEQQADELPAGAVPPGAIQRAVAAIDVHELFLDAAPTVEAVAVALAARHTR
jgi:hypothetical protein